MSEVREESRAGWRALVLDGGALRACVLPEKGADVYELVHAATGVDVLFKGPWGLAPPGSPPREGWGGHPFLANYEGGWQELFPNHGDPCTVAGRELPFHGEVCALPWEARAVDGELELSVRCTVAPLRLVRRLRIPDGETRLVVEETVTNLGETEERFAWGHHLVLGTPLVGAGARLETSARTIVTIPEMYEDTARLAPGQRTSWPLGRGRDGAEVDLREVAGRDAGTHDDVYLTDLDGGWVVVTAPDGRLRARLEWDPAVFRWIISWQPYGGAHAAPLTGAYGLGVEPWTGGGSLADAIEAGEALRLEPGTSLSTALTLTIEEPDGD
jgi:hypothetical protein